MFWALTVITCLFHYFLFSVCCDFPLTPVTGIKTGLSLFPFLSLLVIFLLGFVVPLPPSPLRNPQERESSTGWPQTPSVGKDGVELLLLLPSKF